MGQIFAVLRAYASGALGGRPGSRGGTTRLGPTYVAEASAINYCLILGRSNTCPEAEAGFLSFYGPASLQGLRKATAGEHNKKGQPADRKRLK